MAAGGRGHGIRLLIGPNRRPINLLVIPAETPEGTAIAALARAGDPDDTASGTAILAPAMVDADERSQSPGRASCNGGAVN